MPEKLEEISESKGPSEELMAIEDDPDKEQKQVEKPVEMGDLLELGGDNSEPSLPSSTKPTAETTGPVETTE